MEEAIAVELVKRKTSECVYTNEQHWGIILSGFNFLTFLISVLRGGGGGEV